MPWATYDDNESLPMSTLDDKKKEREWWWCQRWRREKKDPREEEIIIIKYYNKRRLVQDSVFMIYIVHSYGLDQDCSVLCFTDNIRRS